jgi:hypothetical protein
MIFILRHFDLRLKNIFLSQRSNFGKRMHQSEAALRDLAMCKMGAQSKAYFASLPLLRHLPHPRRGQRQLAQVGLERL